jgi:hypothetical protein
MDRWLDHFCLCTLAGPGRWAGIRRGASLKYAACPRSERLVCGCASTWGGLMPSEADTRLLLELNATRVRMVYAPAAVGRCGWCRARLSSNYTHACMLCLCARCVRPQEYWAMQL